MGAVQRRDGRSLWEGGGGAAPPARAPSTELERREPGREVGVRCERHRFPPRQPEGSQQHGLPPPPPSMAQWQEVQQLPPTHLERVHQLYTNAALPMTVRQSLANWIEDQDWYGGNRGAGGYRGAMGGPRGAGTERSRRQQAAEPFSSHARMLFHSLLTLLGEQLGSLGPGDEDFMLKHNLRKARIDLQVGGWVGGGMGVDLWVQWELDAH